MQHFSIPSISSVTFLFFNQFISIRISNCYCYVYLLYYTIYKHTNKNIRIYTPTTHIWLPAAIGRTHCVPYIVLYNIHGGTNTYTHWQIFQHSFPFSKSNVDIDWIKLKAFLTNNSNNGNHGRSQKESKRTEKTERANRKQRTK